MKKLFCLLTILLCLTGAARAETLFAPESGDAFRTLCASGDTLWVRGAQETVYRFDAQTGEIALLTLPEENVADESGLYHAWAGWFCHEGQLCALRVATEPGAGVAEVELCRLTEANGLLVPESAVPLGSSAFTGWEAFSVEGSCVVGDTLCLNVYDGRSEVYLIPLDGSEAAATGLQDARFCPYQDGLLCAIPDEAGGRGYTLLLVDTVTGGARRLASLDEGAFSGLAQEPGTNRLLFVRDGALWAFDPDTAHSEQLAPLPLAPVERGEGLSACLLENGLYAALGEGGLLLQRLTPQETARLVIAEQEETAPVDQAALAFADGAHEINGASGDGVFPVLHNQALVGVDGRQVGELDAMRRPFERLVVELDDRVERRVLLVVARRAHASGDAVALAQAVAAHRAHADVHVVLARQVAVSANEAVAVRKQVENALDHDEALCLEQGVVHGGDQIVALAVFRRVHAELARLGDERFVFELGELVARGGRDDFPALAVLAVAAVAAVAAVVVVAPVALAALVLGLVFLLRDTGFGLALVGRALLARS